MLIKNMKGNNTRFDRPTVTNLGFGRVYYWYSPNLKISFVVLLGNQQPLHWFNHCKTSDTVAIVSSVQFDPKIREFFGMESER